MRDTATAPTQTADDAAVTLTPQAADLLTDCWIEADERARSKPSDHVPVWLDLAA